MFSYHGVWTKREAEEWADKKSGHQVCAICRANGDIVGYTVIPNEWGAVDNLQSAQWLV